MLYHLPRTVKRFPRFFHLEIRAARLRYSAEAVNSRSELPQCFDANTILYWLLQVQYLATASALD
jgi:hypothetical protein